MYKKLMKKCIKLAQKAQGKTSPNPMVGAIIVDDNLKIISSGYHQKAGEPHAEVMAIRDAELKGVDIKGKTLIVNLEPCSHFGKTPPCADLIVKKGIKRLIIGMQDPNPIVKGRGIEKCKNAGIEVIVGVLEKECVELNEVFIKNQIQKKPFVVSKIATTIDGKIATQTGSSKWITGAESRKQVQKIRGAYDAILTGIDTVLADNPSLDCIYKNMTKVILDTHLRMPFDAKIFNSGRIFLATCEKDKKKYPSNVKIIECPDKNGMVNIEFLLKELYKLGICSVLVEAGSGVNSSFLRYGFLDKIYHFMAPKILGDNEARSCFSGFDIEAISQCEQFVLEKVKKIGCDVMMTYKK